MPPSPTFLFDLLLFSSYCFLPSSSSQTLSFFIFCILQTHFITRICYFWQERVNCQHSRFKEQPFIPALCAEKEGQGRAWEIASFRTSFSEILHWIKTFHVFFNCRRNICTFKERTITKKDVLQVSLPAFIHNPLLYTQEVKI